MNIHKNNFNFLQLTIDIFYIVFLYLLLLSNSKITTQLDSFYSVFLGAVLVISWIVISLYSTIYRIERHYSLLVIYRKFFYQILIFTVLLVILLGLIDYSNIDIRDLLTFLVTLVATSLINRFFLFVYFKKIHLRGQNLIKTIIIDTNQNTSKYIKSIHARGDLGYYLEKVILFDEIERNPEEVFKMLSEKFVDKNYAVFFSLNGECSEELRYKIQNLVQDNYINFFLIPDLNLNDVSSNKIEFLDHLPLINLNLHPLKDEFNNVVKRTFDILFSFAVCLFLLMFVFPIIAILIKLDSKGPVFFSQKRRGLNGNEFNCYKFRTMRNDGTNSIQATVVNDTRVTKIGNFLRKTSLDEVPQFFNVLKGDMSIVGPRPHMISQDMHYSEIIKRYNLRNYVKPGITGLAQVKGYRGAIDCDKDMEDRIITDIFYVRNWSLLLDIQIIYQTVVLVFKGDENAI